MPKASDVKKNSAVVFNNSVFIIKDIERSVPQGRAGGSIYRMRMYNVVTGSKVDESFKDSDMLTAADLVHRQVMFSYMDGEELVFMDAEDYTPYNFSKTQIEDEFLFVTEATKGLQVLLIDGQAVALELPQTVELTITETDPSIKGASASARSKPATLETGLIVQVPEYIASGETIKINTAEKRFMSRA